MHETDPALRSPAAPPDAWLIPPSIASRETESRLPFRGNPQNRFCKEMAVCRLKTCRSDYFASANLSNRLTACEFVHGRFINAGPPCELLGAPRCAAGRPRRRSPAHVRARDNGEHAELHKADTSDFHPLAPRLVPLLPLHCYDRIIADWRVAKAVVGHKACPDRISILSCPTSRPINS